MAKVKKFYQGIALESLSADPSGPVEGQIYFSDGTARNKGLWQYKDGDWKAIGGGGVGSFSIFETFDADVDSYNDWTESAGTWAEDTSTHLSGTKSYKWTPNAANDTLDSPSVTLPKRTLDLAGYSPCMVDFAYAASDDGFQAIILDNSSNVLATSDIDSTKNRIQILFNLTGSETSLKLRIKDQTHTASMNIVFDDIVFDDEPFRKIDVSPDTEWTSYTPTGSWVSNASYTGKWRRVGDSMEIFATVNITGAPTATQLLLDIPSGYTIDTGKLPTPTSNVNSVGHATIHDTGTVVYGAFVYYFDTNSVGVKRYDGAAVTSTSPITFANGDQVTFYIKVPISGWSSYNESVLVENADGSEWTSWTPTFTGFGTATSIEMFYRRSGDSLEIRGNFTTGTTTATEARISIPYTSASSLVIPSIAISGVWTRDINNAESGYILMEPSVSYLTFSRMTASFSGLTKENGSAYGSSQKFTIRASVPIQGWSSVQAHIMDIADPYENGIDLTVLQSASPTVTSTPSGIASVAYQTTGITRVTLSSSLALTETPRITVGLIDSPVNVGQVKIEWITPPYVFDVYTGNTAGTLADGYTVDLHIRRKGADYREPKGYFIGQSVPMRTAYVKDVKSSGTDGGTFTSGAWQTRDLNTVEGDSSFLSLSSNQFTLSEGTYEIEAEAPAFAVGRHKARLTNVTDSSYTYGQSAYSDATQASATNSIVKARVVITSSKAFKIEHYSQLTKATDGFGSDTTFGVSEVYTQVKITKVK